MNITNAHYHLKNNKAVFSAEILMKNDKKHEVYFEVDKKFSNFVARDATAFFPLGLALAMKKREHIEIDGEVSKKLVSNTPKIMKILSKWDADLQDVSMGTVNPTKDTFKPSKVGCFFSGGVDSFYTYLKNKKRIKYLIFVHGFDIDVDDFDLYNKIEKNIVKIARKEKMALIVVRTNIRRIFDEYMNWPASHDLAIASVSLLLRRGLKETYVSCGQKGKEKDHEYMSPKLDALWATEVTKLHHYGCEADKIEKLRFLSSNPTAMKNVRVCWVNKNNAYNCCECEKCFRNMLALHLSGALKTCTAFNKKLDLEKLRNIRLGVLSIKYYQALLTAFTNKNDQSEVRFALEECIRNNDNPQFPQILIRTVRDRIGYLDKKYNRSRLYWFLAHKDFI